MQIDEQEIDCALAILRRSERGRVVLHHLSKLLDRGGTSLDASGQTAVLSLLAAAWSPLTGTTLEKIHDALIY